MREITKHYIDGAFVTPHGTEILETFDPVTGKKSGHVVLADEVDTQAAIAAANRALVAFSQTTVEERIDLLRRMHKATEARLGDLIDAMVSEYGGTRQFSTVICEGAVSVFPAVEQALRETEMVRQWNGTTVFYQPVGVAGLITPWNANALFLTAKMASAIAAGCTVVAKPSELSAWQTQVLMECLHDAGVPAGVINVVSGRGDVVGAELVRNPDVHKISFTGSAGVGAGIMRDGAATMKRVTLELGGKSPTVVLDDADFAKAIPSALVNAFLNSGQACAAGTRLLVPNSRMDEAKAAIKSAMEHFPVGLPDDPATAIGPMVSQLQWTRIQDHIQRGIDAGATPLIGGLGKPAGFEDGFFVRPTIFVDVDNAMSIAQEEIFGPVLCVIGYEDEADAIRIANDSKYGLHGFVEGTDPERCRRVARQILAGRVAINGMKDDQQAPFGGFRHSGYGREFG
ncbi:MAG: aldehyde dehydrogenase family protein, partial [Paracoccus sp. (in: a-proteobacteria)]|uniref:aldehyde dehydrogenase family protein n=1 Tax=Paracoccus sp. TaxID=267 RepID=UPI0026E0A4DE